MHASIREGGASVLYISFEYFMQKGGGGGVKIACKNVYVLNGRPHSRTSSGYMPGASSGYTHRHCQVYIHRSCQVTCIGPFRLHV